MSEVTTTITTNTEIFAGFIECNYVAKIQSHKIIENKNKQAI